MFTARLDIYNLKKSQAVIDSVRKLLEPKELHEMKETNQFETNRIFLETRSDSTYRIRIEAASNDMNRDYLCGKESLHSYLDREKRSFGFVN